VLDEVLHGLLSFGLQRCLRNLFKLEDEIQLSLELCDLVEIMLIRSRSHFKSVKDITSLLPGIS